MPPRAANARCERRPRPRCYDAFAPGCRRGQSHLSQPLLICGAAAIKPDMGHLPGRLETLDEIVRDIDQALAKFRAVAGVVRDTFEIN